jgi:hypothetical protein
MIGHKELTKNDEAVLRDKGKNTGVDLEESVSMDSADPGTIRKMAGY